MLLAFYHNVKKEVGKNARKNGILIMKKMENKNELMNWFNKLVVNNAQHFIGYYFVC